MANPALAHRAEIFAIEPSIVETPDATPVEAESATPAQDAGPAQIIPFEVDWIARRNVETKKPAAQLAINGISMLIMGFVFLFFAFLIFAGCQIVYTTLKFMTS